MWGFRGYPRKRVRAPRGRGTAEMNDLPRAARSAEKDRNLKTVSTLWWHTDTLSGPSVGMSADAARTSALCHLVFPIPPTCINGGADARVRTRPPGPLVDGGKRLILREKSGTRASRADQGVRPPIMPNPQLCEN